MPILEDPVTRWMAFWATWLSNIICVYLICQHLRHYIQPGYQRYICRIIFIVPFYCTASWLALIHREWSLYFETPRDCYEAWVIYNFMALCMAYVGGPGAVVVKSEGKTIPKSWILCNCCLNPMRVDGFFLRDCKRGTLQFVIAKPFLAAFTLLLFIGGKYQVGDWSPTSGYLYIALIYNWCYGYALFWMLLFYKGTDELLAPYKPLLKFVTFKAVIFLTFWQGLVVTWLATRLSMSPEDSEALQNWLICVEMFVAAVGMLFAFPYQEYRLGGHESPGWKLEALKHAISIADVWEDIMHQFDPNYKSYVLYTDGGPTEAQKKKRFRGKKDKKKRGGTFHIPGMSMGTEMIKAAEKGMKKLKSLDKRRIGASTSTVGDDLEGGEWHSAAARENILTDIRHMARGAGQHAKVLVSWIPGITEQDRRQAELVDSESDAEYDEENQQDNQLDDKVLTTSDDDDDEDRRRPRRLRTSDAAGSGRSAGRLQALPSGTDMSDSGSETDYSAVRAGFGGYGNLGQTARKGYNKPLASDSEYDRGGYSTAAEDTTWARWPSARRTPAALPAAADVNQDSSWAQFPGQGEIVPAADAPAASGANDGADWANFDATQEQQQPSLPQQQRQAAATAPSAEEATAEQHESDIEQEDRQEQDDLITAEAHAQQQQTEAEEQESVAASVADEAGEQAEADELHQQVPEAVAARAIEEADEVQQQAPEAATASAAEHAAPPTAEAEQLTDGSEAHADCIEEENGPAQLQADEEDSRAGQLQQQQVEQVSTTLLAKETAELEPVEESAAATAMHENVEPQHLQHEEELAATTEPESPASEQSKQAEDALATDEAHESTQPEVQQLVEAGEVGERLSDVKQQEGSAEVAEEQLAEVYNSGERVDEWQVVQDGQAQQGQLQPHGQTAEGEHAKAASARSSSWSDVAASDGGSSPGAVEAGSVTAFSYASGVVPAGESAPTN